MRESITAVTVEIKSKREDLIKNGYYPKTFCKTIHILSFFPLETFDLQEINLFMKFS